MVRNDDYAWLLIVAVIKFVGHILATRSLGKIYEDHGPHELAISVSRTAMGILAGVLYSMVMNMVGFTPWGDLWRWWHTAIFLVGTIPLNAAMWWWAVYFFYERHAMHPRPFGRAVAAGCAWSLLCDVPAVVRILPVHEAWII